MHNQPYLCRIALCTRKKLLKSGEIRHFYGIEIEIQLRKRCHERCKGQMWKDEGEREKDREREREREREKDILGVETE